MDSLPHNVIPMKDYRDPREQAVAPPESVQQAKADCEAQRELAGLCVGCGVMMARHWNLSGQWIGCESARRRELIGPRNPERWNDPYVAITIQVQRAMVDGTCGPRFEIEMGGYAHDEQLTIAATLARIAITAYLREMSK